MHHSDIAFTAEEWRRVKKAAIDQGTSASALVRKWALAGLRRVEAPR